MLNIPKTLRAVGPQILLAPGLTMLSIQKHCSKIKLNTFKTINVINHNSANPELDIVNLFWIIHNIHFYLRDAFSDKFKQPPNF